MIHWVCPRNGEINPCPHKERDPRDRDQKGPELSCGVLAPHRREVLLPKGRREVPYCDFHRIGMVPA